VPKKDKEEGELFRYLARLTAPAKNNHKKKEIKDFSYINSFSLSHSCVLMETTKK
jgi:hypothetical protein